MRLWQLQLGTGEFEVGCEEARRVQRGQAIRKEARQAEALQARPRAALLANPTHPTHPTHPTTVTPHPNTQPPSP